MFKKSRGLIIRSEVANILRQFNEKEDYSKKYSQADLECIKSLLLPVKATLIKGIQDYKLNRHLKLNKYQMNHAETCLQYLQRGDLDPAYNYLQQFFDETIYYQEFCGYSELIAGILLIDGFLEICNSRLKIISEIQENSWESHGLKYIVALPNGITPAYAIYREIENWRTKSVFVSLHDYFELTDSEKQLLYNSIYDSLKTIITNRNSNKNTALLPSEKADRNPCFFSALGASSQKIPKDSKKKVKVKPYEIHHSKT